MVLVVSKVEDVLVLPNVLLLLSFCLPVIVECCISVFVMEMRYFSSRKKVDEKHQKICRARKRLPRKRESGAQSTVVRELDDIVGVAYTWMWCTLITFVTQSHADRLILSLVKSSPLLMSPKPI